MVAEEAEATRQRIKELNKAPLSHKERARMIQAEKDAWWMRVKDMLKQDA